MSQQSDDLFLGTAVAGGSFASPSGNPSPMTVGVGPMGRIYLFDVVPAASGATTTQNDIATSQNLPLGALTLTAGGGNTSGTDPFGNTIIILDCERTVAAYSASNLSGSTLTVSGYDRYGFAMSQVITGPNNSTVQTTKCFKSILSISSSGAIASAIVVGVGTGIGLPYRVTDLGYFQTVWYNQTAITISSTLVKVADTTSPATTSTTDVRGYIVVGQTDGAKRLVAAYGIPALGSGPNATRIGAFGVTQV